MDIQIQQVISRIDNQDVKIESATAMTGNKTPNLPWKIWQGVWWSVGYSWNQVRTCMYCRRRLSNPWKPYNPSRWTDSSPRTTIAPPYPQGQKPSTQHPAPRSPQPIQPKPVRAPTEAARRTTWMNFSSPHS